MELVKRLTEQDVTPGTFDTAFSTLVLHAAQLIPVTEYCFILFTPAYSDLFHQLLKYIHQLVYFLIITLTYILSNTGVHVPRENLTTESIQCSSCRR